jgi:hypothetical protein
MSGLPVAAIGSLVADVCFREFPAGSGRSAAGGGFAMIAKLAADRR